MEKTRILNRIVFINIANTDYTSVEIAGNTCFVGTNNMGKTTLQRAILFFYSANTRGLGISGSQKSFEDYYFQYPNSYIIYEVATEEGFFHVMVYRHNKICYRFIDHSFDNEFYITNNEALVPREVTRKMDEKRVDYSDQVETFERYRNIIYGADPDKKFRKYALLKGNSNYHNIPLAITSIFLSSESVIKAEFVKDSIANSISTKHTNIELRTVERQLRQFTERYQDIETFFKKENLQRGALIGNNFSLIKETKNSQKVLANSLGGALKYAVTQKDIISQKLSEFKIQLEELSASYREEEEIFQEQKSTSNQEIGALKAKLKEAATKQQDYDKLNIQGLLAKAERREILAAEINAREIEYATLTAEFKDVEQQFRILFDALANEKKEFENSIAHEGFVLDAKFQNQKNILTEEFKKAESLLKDTYNLDVEGLKDSLHKQQLQKQSFNFQEKDLKKKKYFEQEIQNVRKEVQTIAQKKYQNISTSKIKLNEVESLKKESDFIKEKNKILFEDFAAKNKEDISKITESIVLIDNKLSVHQHAFFGFLQENYPDWISTIGKVCNEEILFNKNLNPVLLKKNIDTLYGIGLDLSSVNVHSKSIEQYESEKSAYQQQLSELNSAFLNFRETQTLEEQNSLALLGKKISNLKAELNVAEYDLQIDEQKEKQYSLDILDWERKGESMRESELVELFSQQEQVDTSIKNINEKIHTLKEKLNKELENNKSQFHIELSIAKESFENAVEKVTSIKEEKLEALNAKKSQLQKDKSSALKNKGIDDSGIKKLSIEITGLKNEVRDIEKNASVLNDYKKDQRELFDFVDQFKKDKEKFENTLNNKIDEFKSYEKNFSDKKSKLDQDSRAMAASLKSYQDGLNHFEEHFREKNLYEKLRHIIEVASPLESEIGIIALCSKILANDLDYHRQFENFKNNITEFSGRFRPDNHLNFKIEPHLGDQEFERFASYLQEFYAENKIQISIAEVAKNHGMLIDAISAKVKALVEHKGRITRMIGKMESDFSKATFESSKLIEYIRLKSEDSENKVLKKLQKIAEFREQNPFIYGDSNLFNQDNKAKSDIDRKSVELLSNLQKTISEENYDEVRVQDLFELKFRIKEGKNDTGWIEKIDKVGSTGTDMLVKAVIYITLLNVFIKESTERTAQDFKVHCIIDEVGQISAPYLKELIHFAEERNICLVNGLPNESKLETNYNYTYKFRKDARGNVKVIPLLTMSVEP